MFGFGNEKPAKATEISKMGKRIRLSSYLPTIAYDIDSYKYLVASGEDGEDMMGYIFECTPLYFAGGATVDALDGMLSTHFPMGSVIQFILYGDTDVEAVIECYEKLKKREHSLTKIMVKEFADFLRDATSGFSAMSNIPLKTYRLFVTIKYPKLTPKDGISDRDIFSSFSQGLEGAQLQPRPVTAGEYLAWMRSLMNSRDLKEQKFGEWPNQTTLAEEWDKNKELRDQIILAETETYLAPKNIIMGDKRFKVITPKSISQEVDFLQTNKLFGGYAGPEHDGNQLLGPFLFTVNLLVGDVEFELHTKSNFVLGQNTIASMSPGLGETKEELVWALKELDAKVPFFQAIPVLVTWEKNGGKRSIEESASRALRVFQGQRWLMQEEDYLQLPLFLAALPFGLYDIKGSAQDLERHTTAPASSIVPILPVQGDFTGGGIPYQVTVGRKGQIAPFDIFNPINTNHNGFVVGPPGKGKSFLIADIIKEYWSAGIDIRVCDIGKSYRKLIDSIGADFLEFTPTSNVSLNPYTHVGLGNIPEEERQDIINMDMQSIGALALQMAYAATGKMPEDEETCLTLCSEAARWGWDKSGNDADPGLIYRYLETYPKEERSYTSTDEWGKMSMAGRVNLAHAIAFNLRKFTGDEPYARWFKGKATFDVSHSNCVVIEVEELLAQPILFNIIPVQILNALAQDVYLGDRSVRKLFFFDEAHQFLKRQEAQTGAIAKIIDNGYRKFRKCNSGMWIATQGIMDLPLFGPAGEVIRRCSDIKMYMQADDYREAKDKGLINYDDLTMELLNSVRTRKPNYAEVFIDTPFAVGVTRIIKDRFSYYLNSTYPPDNTRINRFRDQGYDYVEAIKMVIEEDRKLNGLF